MNTELITKLFERLSPLVIGILVAVTFNFNYDRVRDVDDKIQSILSTSSTASGTLLGFFFTVTTIVSAIPTRRMRMVREDKPTYRLYLSYMKIAIWLCILVVTFAVADTFIRPWLCGTGLSKPYNIWIMMLSVWSWGASVRFANFFIRSLYDKNDIS